MTDQQETLLKFPCDFPIKVMGRSGEDLQNTVVELVRRHAPDFDAKSVQVRDSRAGNYLSVTMVVRATSKDQLDAIYQDITACEKVVMAL